MRRSALLASAIGLGLLGAAGGASLTGLATAQDAPESLLPPGFDDPVPTPTPTPAPQALPTAAPAPGTAPPVAPPTAPPVSPIEGDAPPAFTTELPAVPNLSEEDLEGLPTLEELEELSIDELDDLLGLKPQFDIPPAARRAMSRVGVLAPDEGGFPTGSLANQPESLVRAVLGGTKGPFVSRWGHILVRRAVATRYAAPEGMDPVEFAALRAGVLNSMGEYAVSRAMVQDVDTGNWDTALTGEALTAYIAGNDLVGVCPAVRFQSNIRDDAQWTMLRAICNAYAGQGALAGSQLNAAQAEEIAPEIDVLLAQRFAGAAGRGRVGTTVNWQGVEELTPWRFAIANAVGETIPEELLTTAMEGSLARYYRLAGATAPSVPLGQRALYADSAAGYGVLSSRALVGVYSQIYSNEASEGQAALRAARLRNAFTAIDPTDRIEAMREIWAADGEDGELDFPGLILTAYAAARIPSASDYRDASGDLIASMLTAGLDRDAADWSDVVEEGSLGWALVALSDPDASSASQAGFEAFLDNDESEEQRKSAFLAAGLAGLGRVPNGNVNSFGNRVGVDFGRQTRWTRTIEQAAQLRNQALVSMLVGLGMQGDSWAQMTPLHLYHITSALTAVGLEAEARMIAAEAVSRG
ncbi:MAG: hypothetical protein AAF697_05985 [Pseudomonadota bacterium]